MVPRTTPYGLSRLAHIGPSVTDLGAKTYMCYMFLDIGSIGGKCWNITWDIHIQNKREIKTIQKTIQSRQQCKMWNSIGTDSQSNNRIYTIWRWHLEVSVIVIYTDWMIKMRANISCQDHFWKGYPCSFMGMKRD